MRMSDAAGDGSLWIKNALNVSSCEVVSPQEKRAPPAAAHGSRLAIFDDFSLQTLRCDDFATQDTFRK